MQSREPSTRKYIVRQQGSDDREFDTSTDAVAHLRSNPNEGHIYVDDELVLSQGHGYSHLDG